MRHKLIQLGFGSNETLKGCGHDEEIEDRKVG